MMDGMVFLQDELTGWRLALGGECGMSWRTVAQGRGEAIERDGMMQRWRCRECGGAAVVAAQLWCNGGGAGWCDAEAAALDSAVAAQDGDEGESWLARREWVRGRCGGARTERNRTVAGL
jgi:hypothetical protein